MKKIIAIGLTLAAMLFVGCEVNNEVSAEDNINFTYIGGDKEFDIYRDDETGVHYLKYSFTNGVGISPRYDANGNIYRD